MSVIRKKYTVRLVARCAVFAACLVLCFVHPKSFRVLEGNHFFKEFSVLHLLWIVWVVDMILQIIPIKNSVALGSQKLFANRFRPMRKKIPYQALREHVVTTTKAAYKVFILWGVLVTTLGVLYFTHVIDKIWLFMICVAFYVCDLICVLIWCPFRLIMKTKCCTTCRIFNWDHLMMLSPLVFVGGFYAISLVVMAVSAWLVWELAVAIHPERFSEITNKALTCAECTDKLCTQYCQKLRR